MKKILFLGALFQGNLWAQVLSEAPAEEFQSVEKRELPSSKVPEEVSRTYSKPLPQNEPKITKYETTRFPTRLIFLNGMNISDTTNQKLENVSIYIDKSGNILITGAHYQVSVQESYHPMLQSETPQVSKELTTPPLSPQP